VNSLNKAISKKVQKDRLGNQLWLKRFNNAIDKKLADPTITNEWLANKMEISQRQLIRKVKDIIGIPPRQYIRIYRLEKAMNILQAGTYHTVKETAHAVGFEKASYFTRKFEDQFGKKPLEILREYGWR